MMEYECRGLIVELSKQTIIAGNSDKEDSKHENGEVDLQKIARECLGNLQRLI